MTNGDHEGRKYFGFFGESVFIQMAKIAVSLVLLSITAIFVSYVTTISPAACSVMRLVFDFPCHDERSDKALQYLNEYRISDFEDHYPGFSSVSADTEDKKRVWTSFSQSVGPDKEITDHTIYAIIEPKHLSASKCIKIIVGKWPKKNDAKWKHKYIILFTHSLKKDKLRNEPIMLMPAKRTNPSDQSKYLYVDGNIKEGFRGLLGNGCDPDSQNFVDSKTKIFRLANDANAQSAGVSGHSNNNIKRGWAYVGMVYEHYWTEMYFEVDVTKAEENDMGELQYSYPLKPKIKALGNVNFRENYIQFINNKWINQSKIGVICKGHEINILTLKRVALVADDSEEYKPKEFDGFWWAEVEGGIGSKCQ